MRAASIVIASFVLGFLVALTIIEVVQGGIVGPARRGYAEAIIPVPPGQSDQQNAIKAIIEAGERQRAAMAGQCPIDQEFTVAVNDFTTELNEARDPHRTDSFLLSNVYKRFVADSILDYEGYELHTLITEIYEQCTGLTMPQIEDQLPEDYIRQTCSAYRDGIRVQNVVVGHRDDNLISKCHDGL